MGVESRPAKIEDEDVPDLDVDKDDEVQGEGDYIAARKFQWEEREFASEEFRVKRAAREAADALDGPEGAELERARQASAQGKSI